MRTKSSRIYASLVPQLKNLQIVLRSHFNIDTVTESCLSYGFLVVLLQRYKIKKRIPTNIIWNTKTSRKENATNYPFVALKKINM